MLWKYIYVLFPSRAEWTNSKAGPFFFIIYIFLFSSAQMSTVVEMQMDERATSGAGMLPRRSRAIQPQRFLPHLAKIQVQGKTSLVSSRSSPASRISGHDSSAKTALVSWRKWRTWPAKGLQIGSEYLHPALTPSPSNGSSLGLQE